MEAFRKKVRMCAAVVLSLFLLYRGLLILDLGTRVLRQWDAVSAAYGACGLVWTVTGPAMLVAGALLLASLGRRTLSWWIAGGAAVLAGFVLAGGVLAHVVPCASPG